MPGLKNMQSNQTFLVVTAMKLIWDEEIWEVVRSLPHLSMQVVMSALVPFPLLPANFRQIILPLHPLADHHSLLSLLMPLLSPMLLVSLSTAALSQTVSNSHPQFH